MVKRRVKKRTHAGAPGAQHGATTKPGSRTPKSMVIRIGASDVGSSVTQLVHDVRAMMEPETASNLKERRNNKLRDYTSMAGPLGVTHLLLFSRSDRGNVQFRLAISPRGPTFCFRVEKYSLAKDVFKGMRRPKSGGLEYLSPPLLVMNNFNTAQQSDEPSTNKHIPKHLETLATTVFQSLFPPINPTTTPLKNIKRILLLDRKSQESKDDRPSYMLDLRHYAIETRTSKALPKALRRLDAAQTLASEKRKRGQVPNLGRLEDMSEYLLDPHAADGFTSGSESEPETDAEVDILEQRTRKIRTQAELEKLKARKRETETASNVQRKGIKLHELGPRMRLRLTKVEEGLCGGKVMWHEWIHKTKQEQAQIEKVHQARKLEKDRRRAEQKANVERKKAERKANGKTEQADDDGNDDLEEDWEDDEFNDDDDDDDEAMVDD